MGKFIAILLALIVAIAGFSRIIDTQALIEGPMLGDSQFLALVLLPLVSLILVVVVFLEALVSGYRSLRSDYALREQLADGGGYLLLRSAEAGLAILGVASVVVILPVLLAESTPASAGVGILLFLFIVCLGILCVSLVRATAELFVFRHSAGTDQS